MNGEENRFSRLHGFITRYRFYITEWFRKSAEMVSLRGICTGLGFIILDLAAKILMAVKCYPCEGLGYGKFHS